MKGVNTQLKTSLTLTTPEAEEQEMIALSQASAKERLLNKTASSQILSIYLKEGTVSEQLKQEKLREEIKLLQAKTEAIKQGADGDSLLAKAMAAFTGYKGGSSDEELY